MAAEADRRQSNAAYTKIPESRHELHNKGGMVLMAFSAMIHLPKGFISSKPTSVTWARTKMSA